MLIILLSFSMKPLRFYYHKRFVLHFRKLLLASVFTVIRNYWSIEHHCNLLRRHQLVFVLLIRVGLFLPWLSWVRLEVDQFWLVRELKKICLLIGPKCFCRLWGELDHWFQSKLCVFHKRIRKDGDWCIFLFVDSGILFHSRPSYHLKMSNQPYHKLLDLRKCWNRLYDGDSQL